MNVVIRDRLVHNSGGRGNSSHAAQPFGGSRRVRRAWFLGDSRINNFDYYKYDTACGDFELELDFTNQRGATVDELLILAQNEFKFKKQNPPDYIKVAVGINDFILRLPYQFWETAVYLSVNLKNNLCQLAMKLYRLWGVQHSFYSWGHAL